ncbi:hypothetical protein [Nostoc sp.]|uniref:hypothetical protein n=1 Tax=Nostoc sp. TaxID=1180 RepID=UPI002FFCE3B1
MELDLKALLAYFQLLVDLKDGDEIFIDEHTIKREGNKIWQHIFDYSPEEEDAEETLEGEGEV